MSKDALASHPLLKLALENIRPLLDEAQEVLERLAEQGEVRSDENVALREHAFYDDDVFSKAVVLMDCVDRLEQSQVLIDAVGKPGWSGAGLDRHTWIEYHYSYYAVTVVSLADIALILTNAVFRLGLRERDCKHSLIAGNWWVAKTPVKTALDNLAELIKPYRKGRNLHVHQGRLQPIAEVMGSKLLDQLKLFSFVERVGKPVVPSAAIEKGYELEVPRVVERLEQERTTIQAHIVAVLDVLHPIYKQKSEALHLAWLRAVEEEAARRGIKPGKN